MSDIKTHFDVAFIPLLLLAVAYGLGLVGFRPTVIMMLAVGLPYGGPP